MNNQSSKEINDPLLEAAKRIVKKKKEFYIVASCSLFLIIILMIPAFQKPSKFLPAAIFSGIVILMNIFYAYSLWGKKTKRKATWEEKAIEREYLKLKEREYQSLNEDEMLELKALERRFDENDLV